MNNNINIAQTQPKNLNPSPNYICGWNRVAGKDKNQSNSCGEEEGYDGNGMDGKWSPEDRKEFSLTWRNAVFKNINDKNENCFEPFQQILDLYYTVQNTFETKIRHFQNHEIKWIKGATYLIDTLNFWTWFLKVAYEYGTNVAKENSPHVIRDQVDDVADWFKDYFDDTRFGDTINLLQRLNQEIANYAISQKFYPLLFGEKSSNALTGKEAFEFDRDFVLKEQRETAYDVYYEASNNLNGLTEDGLEVVDKLLKGEHYWPNRLNYYITISPVFPAYHYSEKFSADLTTDKKDLYPKELPKWTMEDYNLDTSNLKSAYQKRNSKFGQEARFQTPLLMLYPGGYSWLVVVEESYVEKDEFLEKAPLVNNLEEWGYHPLTDPVKYWDTTVREKYIMANEDINSKFNENYISHINGY